MILEYLQSSVAVENAVTCPVAHLKTEAQPASETLCFSYNLTMERQQNGECFET